MTSVQDTTDQQTGAPQALSQYPTEPTPELAADPLWQLLELGVPGQVKGVDLAVLRRQMIAGWQMGVRPLRALQTAGAISREQLLVLVYALIARQRTEEISDQQVDSAALQHWPMELARQLQALPLRNPDQDGVLWFAAANPLNQALAQELARRFPDRSFHLVLADPQSIQICIEDLQSNEAMARLVAQAASGEQPEPDESWSLVDDDSTLQEGSDSDVVQLARQLVELAAQRGASDLHLDPVENEVQVLLRINGVLVRQAQLSLHPARHRAVTLFFKNRAGIAQPNHRIPQDGSYIARFSNRQEVHLRVATLPSAWKLGDMPLEKVTVRLQRPSRELAHLPRLGLNADTLSSLTELIQHQHGLVLVCGPTGHGKTTTLYAVLTHLMSGATPINILTVEDPIEIRLNGINQTEVQQKADLTFARALRAFLRNDPDVMMIGEIRNDAETIQVATEAALTGRLVLSSFHSSLATEVPLRMIEMGVEPYLVASALQGAVAQRLIRILCRDCKQPDPEGLERLGGPLAAEWGPLALAPPERIWRASPNGCALCRHTGYVGRQAVAEVMPMLPSIEEAIMEKRSARGLAQVAREAGVRTLLQDALVKVSQGLTSLDEAIRAVS